MRYLILAFVFVFPINVFAFDYSRTPVGNEISSPVSMAVSITETEWGNGLNSSVHNKMCLQALDINDVQYVTENSLDWTSDEVNGVLTMNLPIGTEIKEVRGNSYLPNSDCWDNSGVATALVFEFDNDNVVFTITSIVEQSTNETWGNDNGFWGDTTPTNIVTSMTASVQDTGASMWFLLTFVGIPIGFTIAGFLIYLINKDLTPTNERKRKSKRSI